MFHNYFYRVQGWVVLLVPVVGFSCASITQRKKSPFQEMQARTPFMRPTPPPEIPFEHVKEGQEQFAWSGLGWVNVSNLTIGFAITNRPQCWQIGYVLRDSHRKTFYRWREIVIPVPYEDADYLISHVWDLKECRVVDVEPIIQFCKKEGAGDLLPGFFDFTYGHFYAFKGIEVPPAYAPTVGPQHRNPILWAGHPPTLRFSV